jgi:hypothetical protein
MSKELVYLATPYSVGKKGSYVAGDTGTASKNLKTRRYKQACKKAAELMEKGYVVFSPIAHSHAVEVNGMEKIRTGDFWLDQDLEILDRCDKLFVYKMKDWEASRGIAREIAFAEKHGIPVEYIEE